MNEAGLHRRWGIDGRDRVGQTPEPVNDSDQDVLDTTGLQVVEDLQPEPCASECSIHRPSTSRRPLAWMPLDLAHAHAAAVQGDDPLVEASEAALVLGDQDRLEAAVAVARQFYPERPMIGDHGPGAGAVALVALSFGLRLAGPVAQMLAHLRTHRPLDDGLLEQQEQILDFAERHRSGDQLIEQSFRPRPRNYR